MFKRHMWELSKAFGSQIDPEKSEELKRTKIDIENNLTRVLKLIKSEEQSKKETELVALIEDFYNQYKSLYVLYGRLTDEYAKTVPPPPSRRRMSFSSFSSSSSDSEYFSSEETDFNDNKRYSAFVNNTLHALKNTTTQPTTTTTTTETHNALRKLELEVENQTREIKQLRDKNAELEVSVSMLHAKLKNNKDQAMSKASDFMGRIHKLEQEAKSLRTQKCKFEEKMKQSRNIKKEFSVMQQNFKELEAQLAETASAERILLQEKEYLVEKHEKEVKELKEKLNELECLVGEKEEKEMVLREDLWKLEGDLSKEGGEKMNLMKEVRELKEKVDELECKFEEKMKQSRNIKKEFSVMQLNLKELESQLAETASAQRNLLQEKECLVEKHEKEVKELKEKVDELECLVGEKEERELVLREKVWKLEGYLSKEGGEKMNLMKAVTQLERRVERLEINVKEKDEELVSVGEQKREAIRQLCFLVEFHRDRCLYLKDLMFRLRVKNKT